MAAPQLKPAEIIDDYVSVFAKVNPGLRINLVYEGGWFIFRTESGSVGSRYRRHAIERLAAELRKHVAEAKAVPR